MAENDKSAKLSKMGAELERSLTKLLKDLDTTEEVDGPNGEKIRRPKYTLIDKMRVYDRALKLEAIQAKLDNDDGSFFGGGDE